MSRGRGCRERLARVAVRIGSARSNCTLRSSRRPPAGRCPEAADAGDGEVAGRRRGPRTGHAARGVPARAVPDAALRRAVRSAWWAPEPRGVIPLDGLRVSRSLRRSTRRFSITVDAGFTEVMRACADRRRPTGGSTTRSSPPTRGSHELGWAHSVEVWSRRRRARRARRWACTASPSAACSRASRCSTPTTDASKVALVALVERLRAGGGVLFDVQWCTPHLASLGAIEIDPRRLRRPPRRRARPPPAVATRCVAEPRYAVSNAPRAHQSWSV